MLTLLISPLDEMPSYPILLLGLEKLGTRCGGSGLDDSDRTWLKRALDCPLPERKLDVLPGGVLRSGALLLEDLLGGALAF